MAPRTLPKDQEQTPPDPHPYVPPPKPGEIQEMHTWGFWQRVEMEIRGRVFDGGMVEMTKKVVFH